MSPTILRGPLLRFAGDPSELGATASIYEADGALAIRGGLIAAVGPAEAVLRDHPGAEVRRTDLLIAPGFVDCHMHYPQIGVIASHGAQLIDWLNRYTFPEEARFGDPKHAGQVARASLNEQLRNGVTTAASFCTVHLASVDACFAEAARRGVRAVAGKVMMDRNAPDDLRDTAQSAHDDSAALIARWHGVGRAVYALSPRFAPTSSPAQLEAAGALWADHADCVMQTHLSENPREVAWVRKLFPACPDYLAVYERFGLVGPRAVFGHAIHLAERERAALAERGASVAHCPTSNLFLGSGECDVVGLAGLGVRVGLASDIGGGTSYSPFATMRAAYEVAQRRGASLSPAHLWWLATAGAAGALHLETCIGNLAPGLEADLVLLDLTATPLLRRRTDRASDIAEVLFALIVLADDRAVAETWSGGKRVHARSRAPD
jgi:guanine deaminase